MKRRQKHQIDDLVWFHPGFIKQGETGSALGMVENVVKNMVTIKIISSQGNAYKKLLFHMHNNRSSIVTRN